MIEDRYPQVHWRGDGTYQLSYADNYKSKEVILSERDFGVLLRSIGSTLERKNRPAEVDEWDRKVAC